MSANIIETENLTKSYGNFTAVSNLSLHIKKGSVYGFLGPNGAGKSTTMKMLLGLTKPSSGSFHINGRTYPKDRLAILRDMGSFIEAPAFYGNLTGEENLEILRRILQLPKSAVEDALEIVGLTGKKVFPGHEAAAGPCRGAAGPSAHFDPGRTHQRAGPHRHP